MIRKLHQEGHLIKVKKGIYKYDPKLEHKRELEDFTPVQKEEIFKRDGYRCVICGLGLKDGVEICVDHIVPKDKGGKAEIDNGQTLCSIHNLRKKNYKQTETGKKMFINLLHSAENINDTQIVEFCREILKTYEKYHINDHIKWKSKK